MGNDGAEQVGVQHNRALGDTGSQDKSLNLPGSNSLAQKIQLTNLVYSIDVKILKLHRAYPDFPHKINHY